MFFGIEYGLLQKRLQGILRRMPAPLVFSEVLSMSAGAIELKAFSVGL